MKGFKFLRVAAVTAVALGLLLSAAHVNAAGPVTLQDNNSTALIDPYSQAGMYQWAVDGQNQLSQQWFWYRVDGMTHDQSIDHIAAPTITQPNARTLYASYNNGSYGVEIDYLMTGFSPGVSNQFSDISESISITNNTASALTFHFFQYSDFDLGGVTGNQTIQLGRNLRGLFNEASQTYNGVALTETVVTPGATRGEAGLFNTTLANLNGPTPYDLSNTAGPLTGDATWALQWDFVIPAFSSVGISKDKYLAIQFIPEPSSLAFAGLAIVGGILYRRRRN